MAFGDCPAMLPGGLWERGQDCANSLSGVARSSGSDCSSGPDSTGQRRRLPPFAMRVLSLALVLGWLCGAFGAEESCEGRCDKGFDIQSKCQCDDLCAYYQSCCNDYLTVCKSKVTRGDVFEQPEDDYVDYYDLPNTTAPVPTSASPEPDVTSTYEYVWTEEAGAAGTAGGTWAPSQLPTESPTTEAHGEDEEVLCSGKPFDAFTSLKNGSIFAFRGKYVYELDEKSAKPGYPKLIQELWGIEGPIDTAFTRINCEGKTYLFKGSQYWRFADGVLEAGYPRSISSGFKGIPNDLDAAFALPAQNYFSSERVYFFKGNKYWTYDFANQPSRAACEETSPSLVFDHYAQMQDEEWEEIFQLLFGGTRRSGASRPRFIGRDWRGVPGHVDAAMLGRLYVAQSPTQRRRGRRPSRRHPKKYRRRQRWGRWDPLWDWTGIDNESSESFEMDWLLGGSTPCQPFQSVYFFVDDKYYRVSLRTRRVDWVYPKYPRPIAKYWLGCPSDEDLA
ncbi:vitronectin [Sceloporus undulatus]|uniref:vitronectin n=1 Tax=Sceloporus undulatus TaxID=8520 RepID=UPI001C4B41A0|nr:vitronectin [Sceloporus undulatus]